MERNRSYDIVIVGGGPAGLSCGSYSARAGRKTVVLESLSPGGQTMIIDEIENYPGLEKISGYELAMKFEAQATSLGCEVEYATVNKIEKKEDGSFTLDTSEGVFEAKSVVLATGAKHRNLDVPGEQEYTGHGVSYCATCDGPFFRGKKVLAVGGGDSACQEAIFLTGLASSVTICHRRNAFRAQGGIVKAMLEKGVRTLMETSILSINGQDGKVKSVTFKNNNTGETFTEDYDGVFVFVGSLPQTSLVPYCEKDDSGYIKTDSHMMTSVPGLFAIGDVRDTVFRQIVTAASDGAIAAHFADKYIGN